MGEGRQNHMRLFERDSNKKILSILLIRNTSDKYIAQQRSCPNYQTLFLSLSSSLRETNPKKKSILPSSFPKKGNKRDREREEIQGSAETASISPSRGVEE